MAIRMTVISIFGRAAAKLDDVVNFFPARISAYLMILSAFVGGGAYDGKKGRFRFTGGTVGTMPVRIRHRQNRHAREHLESGLPEMPVILVKW